MEKKRMFRLSKRVMILLLCAVLVSGSCFNKYKITTHATSIAAGVGAYSLYEICLYVGSVLVTGLGVGYAYENRDQLANLGKDFIDTLHLDEISGWMLSKVNTTGQSYVYGSEALQEVQSTSWEVIEGGGNMPENNDDNDGDGDIDEEDRTAELKNLGLWATSSFANLICDQIQPLLDEVQFDEDNFITESFDMNKDSFSGFNQDAVGNYLYSGNFNVYAVKAVNGCSPGDLYMSRSIVNFNDNGKAYYSRPIVLYCFKSDSSYKYYKFAYVDNLSLSDTKFYCDPTEFSFGNVTQYAHRALNSVEIGSDGNFRNVINCNIPIFESYSAALIAAQTSDYSSAINATKTYLIADWIQEHWISAIESLNTGIRSLNDNMLIVGEAANQALLNQLNGLGYIEDLNNRIATTAPLNLPDSISDPVYFPADSSVPKLDPDDLPWNQPETDSGTDDGVDVDPEPEPEPDVDVDISGYAIDLRTLFPFCIPFDFIALLETLNAEPEAPKFEIPFVVPSLGIEETYVIDLSLFDEQMAVIRKFELVGFIIGLMFLTNKMIKW